MEPETIYTVSGIAVIIWLLLGARYEAPVLLNSGGGGGSRGSGPTVRRVTGVRQPSTKTQVPTSTTDPTTEPTPNVTSPQEPVSEPTDPAPGGGGSGWMPPRGDGGSGQGFIPPLTDSGGSTPIVVTSGDGITKVMDDSNTIVVTGHTTPDVIAVGDNVQREGTVKTGSDTPTSGGGAPVIHTGNPPVTTLRPTTSVTIPISQERKSFTNPKAETNDVCTIM